MKAVFNLKGLDEFKKLEEKIKAIPEKTEEIINDYLHNTASKNVIAEIKKQMPESKKKKGIHAKFGDSLKSVNRNLGFMIVSTQKFQYLVFPALGIGTSRKNKPNDFMNKGLNNSTSKIIEDLEEKISKEMEENL